MQEPGDPFGGQHASTLAQRDAVRPKTAVIDRPLPARFYARVVGRRQARTPRSCRRCSVRPAVALDAEPRSAAMRACAASSPSTACRSPIRTCSRSRCICCCSPTRRFRGPRSGCCISPIHVRLRRLARGQGRAAHRGGDRAARRARQGPGVPAAYAHLPAAARRSGDGDSVYPEARRARPAARCSSRSRRPAAAVARPRVARWQLARATRPRLRERVRRLQPDPSAARAYGEGVRLSARDRARHVDARARGIAALASAEDAAPKPSPSGDFKLPLLLPGEATLWSAAPLAHRSATIEVRDIAGDKAASARPA